MSGLPEGWVNAPLGVVAEWGAGGTPSRKNKNYYGGDIPWIKTGDLGPRKLMGSSELITQEGLENSSAKIFPQGSIAIAMYGATIGKTSILNIDAATNQACAVATPHHGIHRDFLYYLLNNEKENFINKGKGGAQPNISQTIIKEHLVVVPPVNEQVRIANKLDNLLTKVDAAQTRLEKIPPQLKRFRQSVLAAATSGDLTREWRGETSAGTAEIIVEKCLEKVVDKKAMKLATKPFFDDEIKMEIPSTWRWARLSGIAEVVSGLAKGSKTKEEVYWYPYLRVANVQRGYLDLEEVKEIPVPVSRAEKLLLKDGDILFNEGGDIDKLGRGWIWEGQIESCVHQNHVFRARVYSEDIQPRYISYYGNEAAREYFLRGGTQSVNLANLNKTTLSLLPVPLPPAVEQKQIVRRVESLFILADTVERQYLAAKQRVDRLTQSILAKAFRGELVPQDSSDEPASVLLERIQDEREQQIKSKPKRKKSTSKKTAKSKKKIMIMKLNDAPTAYLAKLLSQLGGEAQADVLWKKSELSIDDFYAKLKKEMAANTIIEDNSSPDPSLRKLKIAS